MLILPHMINSPTGLILIATMLDKFQSHLSQLMKQTLHLQMKFKDTY